MMWKTAKMLVLVTIVTLSSGCQLLIDNRDRVSGAVVVVPSDEWEAMRQASLNAKSKQNQKLSTQRPKRKL